MGDDTRRRRPASPFLPRRHSPVSHPRSAHPPRTTRSSLPPPRRWTCSTSSGSRARSCRPLTGVISQTGVDGDATLHANDAGFANYSLRVRRLVDISRIDTSVSLFGTTWQSPIFLDPVGSQRAFHPDGEIASAKAARAQKHLQILSTVASTGVEDVSAARGEPVWYQLYPTDQWPVTLALVRRVEAAGCPVLVLTVDLQGGSNRVTLARAKRARFARLYRLPHGQPPARRRNRPQADVPRSSTSRQLRT